MSPLQHFGSVTLIVFFMIFFPITVTVAMYSIEKAEKMKNLSVTVIELNFGNFFDKCHGRDS